MKTMRPICWKSFVLRFSHSSDLNDVYQGDGFGGRLTYSRSLNLWCATLHGASHVGEGGRDGGGDHDAARLALDGAVIVLQGRVACDQQFLDRLAAELG